MRVRLKPTCGYSTMNTPYGLFDHEWKEVKEGTYVYKEMEIEGQEAELPKKEAPVKELAVEEEAAPEEVPEETKEEKPVVKGKPKKKARRKRK